MVILCILGIVTTFPFSKQQISGSPKLKEFADDNIEFEENGGKVSKQKENAVGKEKLLIMSNFSFSHSVFKRLVLQTRKKQGHVWERVEVLPQNPALHQL